MRDEMILASIAPSLTVLGTLARLAFPTSIRGANEHCAYGAVGLTNIAPFHFTRGRLYGTVECEPLSTT